MTKSHIKSFLFLAIMLSFKSVLGQRKSEKGYQILSSNLGISGSSNTVSTSRGIYKLSQSIGQSSAIGTSTSKGYFLRQGYQQPQGEISVESTNNDKLNASIYPNPFQEILTISFSEEVKQPISVIIFDVNGKQVFLNNYQPTSLLELNLEHISRGAYFLKMTSGERFFSAKLIKK